MIFFHRVKKQKKDNLFFAQQASVDWSKRYPYHRSQLISGYTSTRKKTKKYFLLSTIPVLIIAGYFLFFTRYFTIEKIEVTSDVTLTARQQEIARRAQDKIEEQYINKNIFLIRGAERAIKVLSSEYPEIQSMSIKRKLLTTLLVEISFRAPLFIYYQDASSSPQYLDTTLTAYPLFDVPVDAPALYNEIGDGGENFFPFIQNSYLLLKKNTEIVLSEIRLQQRDGVPVAVFFIKNGPFLITRPEDAPDTIAKYARALKEKLQEKFFKLQYIDLRFGEQVYYK
ncbi:MAG: hypothetical protein HYW78_00605 [Parcubacteria group bacterium]|nr:hypothetical protein [Parcubacteria group bacterium]